MLFTLSSPLPHARSMLSKRGEGQVVTRGVGGWVWGQTSVHIRSWGRGLEQMRMGGRKVRGGGGILSKFRLRVGCE